MSREDISLIWYTKQVKKDTEIKHGRTRRWVMRIGLFESKYNPPQHKVQPHPHSNFTSGIASPATNSQTQLWLWRFPCMELTPRVSSQSFWRNQLFSPVQTPSHCSQDFSPEHRTLYCNTGLHRAHSNRYTQTFHLMPTVSSFLTTQLSVVFFFLNYLLPGFRFIPVTHCCSDLLGVPLPKVPAQQITAWLHQKVLPNQCSLSIRVTS